MSKWTGVDALVLGRDPRLAAKLSGVAGVLFAVTFLFHLPPAVVRTPISGFGFSLVWLGLLVFAAPVVGAYLNDGLLVCIALASGPSYGFFLPLTLFDLSYPSESVLWGLGTGGLFAVVFGATGFLVGAGSYRAVQWVRTVTASPT